MEITSMLSENTEVPMPFRAQEAPAARSSTTPKSSKRKGLSSAPKTDARSKRAVAASKHRLSGRALQGELTWQKEGILGDLRQMLRISEEHHQREIQRIWANPSLCALARIQNGGRDNSDRGRSVYDILPDPKSPSDTESEVEDANSVVKKKKKKKKSASALPKPVAPSLQPSVGEPLLPPPPPPPVAASAFVAPSSTAERPSTKLVLKKAAKKAPDVKKDEAADGAPLASAVTAAAPAPAKPAGVDEMTKLQMERQKLQEELARLADEDEDEDDDGQDEASPAAGGGDDGSEEDA